MEVTIINKSSTRIEDFKQKIRIRKPYLARSIFTIVGMSNSYVMVKQAENGDN